MSWGWGMLGRMHAWEKCGIVICRARFDGSFFCTGNPLVYSKAVDIFNAITGNWSTAVLSEGRQELVATSLPNHGLAIFAGGVCTSCDCYCDDCREGCGVRGMCECGAVWWRMMHCCVQVTLVTLVLPKLWTSLMRSRETGALQTSAWHDQGWPPHRCRIKDSRSSLVAKVRRVTVIVMIAGRFAL